MKLDSQLPCRELEFFPIECRACALWIPEHSHAGELGNHFLEQLQPFSSQLRAHLGQPRDVAAGPRQALNQPTRNRVTRSRHNDRDSPGSFLGSQSIGSNGSDDDVNLETDEIGCEVREAIASTLRIAVLDADVLSLDPSEVAETEPECLVPERGIGRREWREKSYPGDFCRRLRACCARPGERTSAKRDNQLATIVHSPPLAGGHYARLWQGQQSSELFAAGRYGVTIKRQIET